MAEERIVITIDENGGLTAKTSGFKGETCLDALSDILDSETNCARVEKTDAFYQKQRVQKQTLQKMKVK